MTVMTARSTTLRAIRRLCMTTSFLPCKMRATSRRKRQMRWYGPLRGGTGIASDEHESSQKQGVWSAVERHVRNVESCCAGRCIEQALPQNPVPRIGRRKQAAVNYFNQEQDQPAAKHQSGGHAYDQPAVCGPVAADGVQASQPSATLARRTISRYMANPRLPQSTMTMMVIWPPIL